MSGAEVERFRLRRFIGELERAGELETVSEPLDLIDVAARLDGNPKAVIFRNLRSCELDVVGNVMSSRERIALAFGVTAGGLLAEVARRVQTPIAPAVIASADAPVHEVVWTGADADLMRLPVPLQHGDDGSLYISAGIDISRSFDGARRNVGYRRLMLRGPHEAGIDLVAPSDLHNLYAEYVEHETRMPIAFAVGSHPADSIAAVGTWPAADELALAGALRGAAVPLVRCVTIDAEVPADAEIVLEGYLDERGWSELEGPYGEFYGYYGPAKYNPVFHLTAITMRHDALFQTLAIGGRHMATTDTAQLNAIRTEAAVWTALQSAVREPVAVYAPPVCGGVSHLRIALRQRVPGEARNAIAAAFGSNAEVKHVFVVDPDIDIFSDEQMEWALATRFQADRDLVVGSHLRAVPLDPSLRGSKTGAKAGFDLTIPMEPAAAAHFAVPGPPQLRAVPHQPVPVALADGPRTFRELVEIAGTRDGRDVVRALDDLRRSARLERLADGRYALKDGAAAGDTDQRGGNRGDESGHGDHREHARLAPTQR
jgi:UbiD family decarboxylase